MGVKLTRGKERNVLLSFIYRVQKLLPLSRSKKLKLFLDLEWIFDRLAHETSHKLYSVENHPARTFSRAFMLDGINSADTILDLGCKHGHIAYYLAKKAHKVVGIDFDEVAIGLAKDNYKLDNLTFEIGEAHQYLSQGKIEFDILILSHILEHLDDPLEFMQRFKSFFKRIYIEVPDFDRGYLNHYRKDHGVKLIYSDSDHISEFDRFEMKQLISSCNLSIVKEEFRNGVQKFWCEVGG